MLFQNWPISTFKPLMEIKVVMGVDNFTYLQGLISLGLLVLWPNYGTKSERSVNFLYFEAWTRCSSANYGVSIPVNISLCFNLWLCNMAFKIENICRLVASGHKHLWNIVRVCLGYRVSNDDFRRRVLVKNGESIGEIANLRRRKWLEYVLCALNHIPWRGISDLIELD